MPTQLKIGKVKISDIVIDRSRNVRIDDDKSYDLRPLIDDIAFRGQMTEIVLEKDKDGKLYPVRGFRRSDALRHLATNVDPVTGRPYIDPLTNKPFEFANVKVYENLTGAERIEMMFDHGQTKNLNRLEFYRAIKKTIDAQFTELQIVTMGRGLFEIFYPLDEGVEDTNEARLDFWKGALQVMKLAATGPRILEELYEKKLNGQAKWPTNKELRELVGTFKDEMAEDRLNKISQDEPGPKFMEHFNRVKTIKETTPAGNKPKSAAMLNNTQLGSLKTRTKSRILRIYDDIVLSVTPLERFGQLDELMVRVEKLLSPEDNQILDVIGVPVVEAAGK